MLSREEDEEIVIVNEIYVFLRVCQHFLHVLLSMCLPSIVGLFTEMEKDKKGW
jgi:hypothetical protein